MRLKLYAFCCLLLLAACGGDPTPFPTVGVTVQAFPHVEIFTATSTDTPTATPLPPTETPLPPTETPLPTETPVPTFTATALIQLAPPTATTGFVQPTLPRATRPPPATPTSPPPPAAAIRFRSVQFVSAQHDQNRPPNGSITTLSIEFTGSRPPFTLKLDDLVGSYNVNGDGQFDDSSIIYTFIFFRALKTCGGPIVGAITVTGGDGQAFTHDYFVPSAPCS
jgi:hypothetical protein